ADQCGRLTFTADLASAIAHLLATAAPFGIYNVSGAGEPRSWADIARTVYRVTGHDPAAVSDVTTAEYFAGVDGPVAPRPLNSVLDLGRIEATGWTPRDADAAIEAYLTTPAG
ncbi:sugar nucleotide-binding protein, partial [Microbacterium sp. ISL-103]|uniref:sugar nucleotide-binding protein n=1 Tax=Microbacterium sp. ISL-103 TaxID=2819156 RepID=UPI001BED224F